MAWTGSRKEVIESNARLLDDLANYPESALVEFITKERTRLADAIRVEQTTEFFADQDRYGAFD